MEEPPQSRAENFTSPTPTVTRGLFSVRPRANGVLRVLMCRRVFVFNVCYVRGLLLISDLGTVTTLKQQLMALTLKRADWRRRLEGRETYSTTGSSRRIKLVLCCRTRKRGAGEEMGGAAQVRGMS